MKVNTIRVRFLTIYFSDNLHTVVDIVTSKQCCYRFNAVNLSGGKVKMSATIRDRKEKITKNR